MEENTEQRVDLTLFSEKIQELKDQIASVIVGQEQTVDLVLAAILANGHVLIEGVPGVAKTLLARLTARLIDADFSRIQFTPDLMPSDVLGTTVFNMKTNDFDFHQGPIFCRYRIGGRDQPCSCQNAGCLVRGDGRASDKH